MGIDRRQFAGGLAAATALAAARPREAAAQIRAYRGPTVILVRFGGGVRRRETIEPATSFAPRLLRRLAPRGVLIPDMRIAVLDGVDTSHAEGTLNLLTGRYRAYRGVEAGKVGDRLEPTEPTLFEYLRRAFDVPSHQALLINGEDRPQEEFFSYGAHPSHGVAFRSEVLSLRRFKRWNLARKVAAAEGTDAELEAARKALSKLAAEDYRGAGARQGPEIDALWAEWRAQFGDTGLKNPRGDAALTELALWALRRLSPKLMMINYQDPDYAHWGNASHYTRAIARIDQGLERLVAAVDADEGLRERTVFVVVPDCGRDANALMSVPFQHHFNSRSAHEIWALMFGPGIARGRVIDKPMDQTQVAATVAGLMGFRAGRAEGAAIEEAFT